MKLIFYITRYPKNQPINSLIYFESAKAWPDPLNVLPNGKVALSQE